MLHPLCYTDNWKLLLIIGVALELVFLFLFISKSSLFSNELRVKKYVSSSSKLVQIAKRRASKEGNILISYFDLPFLNLALNFYETSIKRLNVSNFLFLSSHSKCCIALNEIDKDSCLVYKSLPASSEPCSYGELNFAKKSNIRNGLILDLLDANLSVLYSDVDVYLFKNPFNHINCSDCDIATQVDFVGLNSGFVYVKPTKYGREIYVKMNQLALSNNATIDQDNLNAIIKNFNRRYKDFTIIRLPRANFTCGKYYFRDRIFAGDQPCNECVQIHNNYISSMEAKEYRAKEAGLWDYDGDQYFSSPSRKYILFDNPFFIMKNPLKTVLEEHESFISAIAIAEILNRTIILPAFRCGLQLCSLLSRYDIRAFYTQYGATFREHSFLKHNKVPLDVVNDRSKKIIILTKRAREILINNEVKVNDNLTYLVPKNVYKGATDEEIINWFGKDTTSILQFHSLYGSFYRYNNRVKQTEFQTKVRRGLKLTKTFYK